MQASLRKKIKEHFSSKAHRQCAKQEEYHAVWYSRRAIATCISVCVAKLVYEVLW